MKWTIMLLVVGVAGCISLPVPPPVVEPEPPPIPSWVVVIATVPDARVTAYREDAADLALDATADADGFVRAELEQAGYTFCSDLDGFVSKCVGVDVAKDGTPVALHLEAVPPPLPPEPEPVPVPPAPVPSSCGPVSNPTLNRVSCVGEVARQSEHWPKCQAGSGVACHRFTREVAAALAAGDPRWGLITKQGNQQKCSWDACGPNVPEGEGYGEDVVAYLPAGQSTDRWVGFDIIGGAGAPGARTQWVGPLERRPGNLWAVVP